MLLQQLQERRLSISSPLPGGSDRDRRGSGDLVIGKPGAQSPRTNVSAKTGNSNGGLVIGRTRSPDTRQGSPSQPLVSPGRLPTNPPNHSASPQQVSPLGNADSSSPSADARRQAMADQLNALKRELMLKHSDRRKLAPTNMASAAMALSPTTVAEPSTSAAKRNLEPSTTVGNSYAKLSPDEHKEQILALFLSVAPGMKMFKGVDIRLIHRLCACVDVIRTEDDVRLIEADSEGHSMFFLLQGQCDVLVTGKRVSRLEAPCAFGEIALLLSERRSADVQTNGPCLLCELAQVLSLSYVLACSDLVHFPLLFCHPFFLPWLTLMSMVPRTQQADFWNVLNEFPSAANTINGTLKLQAVQNVKNAKGAMRTIETHPQAKEEVRWMGNFGMLWLAISVCLEFAGVRTL